MPAFSALAPFGLLEYSSAPSDAEKIYKGLRAAFTDPATGRPTLELSEDTYLEAKLYAWAIAIAGANVTLRHAGNELRPETSYCQLEAHERKFGLRPGAEDTVAQRRAALAARQKAARGPRYEAIIEGLEAILGDALVAYRPISTAETETWPSVPSVGPGIFRRHDAVASSVRLLDAVARTALPEKFDEVATASRDADASIYTALRRGVGQTFLGNGGHLTKVKWYLKKTGSPTGNATAKVYEHTGTFGTDGLPLGDAIATSATVDVSTLTGSFVSTEFTFEGREHLALDRPYVVTLEYTGGDASNYVHAGTDSSSPAHDGNAVYLSTAGAWSSSTSVDFVFALYAGVPVEVAYENWDRSLVEVNLVRGDVLCIDPGNLGLAEKVTVLDSSGSGDTRTFTADFSSPHSADVMGTTAPMPIWTSTKRHVLIVVDSDSALDPVTVARVDDLLRQIMRGPTTWAIVQETTPGSGTVGPFAIGSTSGSPLGAVTIESITI